MESTSEANLEAGNAFGGRSEAAQRRKAMSYQSSNRHDGYVCSVENIASIQESVVGNVNLTHMPTPVLLERTSWLSHMIHDVSPYSDNYNAVVGAYCLYGKIVY
jgi:hypothetical protein